MSFTLEFSQGRHRGCGGETSLELNHIIGGAQVRCSVCGMRWLYNNAHGWVEVPEPTSKEAEELVKIHAEISEQSLFGDLTGTVPAGFAEDIDTVVPEEMMNPTGLFFQMYHGAESEPEPPPAPPPAPKKCLVAAHGETKRHFEL